MLLRGSVKPVDASRTGCISVFALPSLPIFKTTDWERGNTLARELDLGSGARRDLIGEDRPFDGLFRIPLAEDIVPPEPGRDALTAFTVRLRVSAGLF
jgi:hypothetical protein